MPKGKKFDAAEKKIKEKELKLNRLMRSYENSAREANAKASALQAENEALRSENEELKRINQQLKELHELSDADIKTLLNRAHSLETFAGMMNIMNRLP